MGSVRRSVYLSAASRFFELGIQFIVSLFIARLLTPSEIGVYSVSVAFIALAHTLRDFGVQTYLIQEKELDEQKVRAAFSIACIVSLFVAIAAVVFSTPVGRLYRSDDVATIMRILSIAFLLIPFGLPAKAMLTRQFAFGRLVAVSISAAAANAVTTLVLAFLGYKYFSMAWGAVAGSVTSVIVLAIACPDLALLKPYIKGWREIVRFCSFASGSSIVSEIGIRAPDFFLGWLQDFRSVGLYSRGNGVLSMFTALAQPTVRIVALPAFAAAIREDRDVKAEYLRGVSMFTAVAWPFYGCLAVIALPVVRLLFGPQWDASVPVTQVLCVGQIIFAPAVVVVQFLQALGKVRNLLHRELLTQGVRVLAVFAMAPWGIVAVAFAQLLVYFVALLSAQYQLRQFAGITLNATFSHLKKSLVLLFAAVLFPYPMILFCPSLNPWILVPICAAGSFTGWLIACFATRHPMKDELVLGWKKACLVLSGK